MLATLECGACAVPWLHAASGSQLMIGPSAWAGDSGRRSAAPAMVRHAATRFMRSPSRLAVAPSLVARRRHFKGLFANYSRRQAWPYAPRRSPAGFFHSAVHRRGQARTAPDRVRGGSVPRECGIQHLARRRGQGAPRFRSKRITPVTAGPAHPGDRLGDEAPHPPGRWLAEPVSVGRAARPGVGPVWRVAPGPTLGSLQTQPNPPQVG